MGRYAYVDNIGENDMDSALSIIDWFIGMEIPPTFYEGSKMLEESASMRGDDTHDCFGSRCG